MRELFMTVPSSADTLPVRRLCQALGLSRATYYRWQEAGQQPDQDLELRAQVQEIALEMPAYGYRHITHTLRRRGVVANHQRVLRVMH
jgi:transposase InsO family protein